MNIKALQKLTKYLPFVKDWWSKRKERKTPEVPTPNLEHTEHFEQMQQHPDPFIRQLYAAGELARSWPSTKESRDYLHLSLLINIQEELRIWNSQQRVAQAQHDHGKEVSLQELQEFEKQRGEDLLRQQVARMHQQVKGALKRQEQQDAQHISTPHDHNPPVPVTPQPDMPALNRPLNPKATDGDFR